MSEVERTEKLKELREKITQKVRNDAEKIKRNRYWTRDCGRVRSIEIGTEKGTWTLKMDEKGILFLRLRNDTDTYVIGQRGDAPDRAFLAAMKDYRNFIERYNMQISASDEEAGKILEDVGGVAVK